MNINYPIPDGLHRQLKIRAAELGITLKELIVVYLALALYEDDFDTAEQLIVAGDPDYTLG